jgi:hypothetical protein
LVAHEDVGHDHSENDGADPSANKTFDGLLRRNLDQLGATKGDSANVGEDVIGDDQRSGKEEPNHSLENIVDDEVRLHNNKIQCHVSPCELGELELVVTLLQGHDEEHKSCHMLAPKFKAGIS